MKFIKIGAILLVAIAVFAVIINMDGLLDKNKEGIHRGSEASAPNDTEKQKSNDNTNDIQGYEHLFSIGDQQSNASEPTSPSKPSSSDKPKKKAKKASSARGSQTPAPDATKKGGAPDATKKDAAPDATFRSGGAPDAAKK